MTECVYSIIMLSLVKLVDMISEMLSIYSVIVDCMTNFVVFVFCLCNKYVLSQCLSHYDKLLLAIKYINYINIRQSLSSLDELRNS